MRALVLSLVLMAGAAAAQDRPVIAAVTYPLAWMAERLTDGRADVLFDVPQGRDPAFWRPSLADIGAIQQADVIALNGAGYAGWVTKASLPRAALVDTSRGFAEDYIATETDTHSHGADGAHSHTGTATHTWLDFALAARQAAALARRIERRTDLGDLRPTLGALQTDLLALDAAARQAARPLQGQVVLASHPRYQYFARAYGLTIAALDWEAGAMPTDAQWQSLAARAAETEARIFLWEATPPAAAQARLETLGLTGVVLSPLANRPTDGDFLSEMTAALGRLAASATR